MAFIPPLLEISGDSSDQRCLGFRIQVPGFRVQGSGFGIQGSGFSTLNPEQLLKGPVLVGRRQAYIAHIRLSRTDSGIGFEVKVLMCIESFPVSSSLGSKEG